MAEFNNNILVCVCVCVCVCVTVSLSVCVIVASISGCLGCVHIFVIVNNAVVNIEMQITFSISVFIFFR